MKRKQPIGIFFYQPILTVVVRYQELFWLIERILDKLSVFSQKIKKGLILNFYNTYDACIIYFTIVDMFCFNLLSRQLASRLMEFLTR